MAKETLRVKKLVNRNPHEISGEEIQTSLCLQLYTNSNSSFQHVTHLVISVIEVGLDSFTQFTKGIFVLSKTRNYTINILLTKLSEHTENKIYYSTFLLLKSCQYFPKDPLDHDYFYPCNASRPNKSTLLSYFRFSTKRKYVH